jgi:hypothetical protein
MFEIAVSLWNAQGIVVGTTVSSRCLVVCASASVVHIVAQVRSEPHQIWRAGRVEIVEKGGIE